MITRRNWISNLCGGFGAAALSDLLVTPEARAAAAVPVSHPAARQRRERITGDIPSALHPPSGCRFHTRCPYVMPICREVEPKMTQPVPGHQVACHLVNGK